MLRSLRWILPSLAVLATLAVAGGATAQELPTPDVPSDASVKWLEPADGATVKSPVKLRFEAAGITTEPAGKVVKGAGHHHVLIDTDGIRKGRPIPADSQHLHYGKAQTEAEIELPPGKHTLTLQFADGLHRSYGPQLSASIEIVVE